MLLVLHILSLAIEIYTWILIATILVSWLIVFRIINPYNPTIRNILRALAMVTEPVLRPIRRVIPTPGGLDFSPLVVLLILYALQFGIDLWARSLTASALGLH